MAVTWEEYFFFNFASCEPLNILPSSITSCVSKTLWMYTNILPLKTEQYQWDQLQLQNEANLILKHSSIPDMFPDSIYSGYLRCEPLRVYYQRLVGGGGLRYTGVHMHGGGRETQTHKCSHAWRMVFEIFEIYPEHILLIINFATNFTT